MPLRSGSFLCASIGLTLLPAISGAAANQSVAKPEPNALQNLLLLGGIVVFIGFVFWLMRLLHRTSESLSRGSSYSHADTSTTDAENAMFGRHGSNHGSDGNPFD